MLNLATSLAQFKTMDPTTDEVVYLNVPGREGMFTWNSADLSALLSRPLQVTADAATNRLLADWAVATTTDPGTNTITISGGNPFVEDQEITTLSTLNNAVAHGRYFAFNVTATTFQYRTSLTAPAAVITGSTNATWCALTGLWTGEAIVLDSSAYGLTAGVTYYVRRQFPHAVWLAPTYKDARNGTNLIDITGSGSLDIRVLHDPLNGRFMVPDGYAADGSQGAYVRAESFVNAKHCGALGDGLADDGHALQEAVWLGARLRLPIKDVAGIYRTSTPIKRETHDWLATPNQSVPFGHLPGPDNGIVWTGPGQELMVLRKASDFPSGEYLISYDGNPDAIAAIVGSRPMAQGKNFWGGMRLEGLGRYGETDDKLVFIRGVWTQHWRDIGMREASGDFVTVDTGAVSPANEEVDNIGSWVVENCRLFEGGGSAFTLRDLRIAGLVLRDSEIRGFDDWGINGTPVYSEIHGNVFAKIGNRENATTGAIRITDALSGADARTLKISSNVFEANFNHDIDLVMSRGARILDNSFHTFLPSGGAVANKASVKLRSAGVDVTHTIELAGNRWAGHSAPPDGAWYDAPHIQIDVGVKGVTWHDNVHEGVGTHLKTTSPNRLHLVNWPSTYNYVRAGAAPVASYKNYAALT